MAGVERQRATELAELLLTTLDGCQREWPASLVTKVYVFGSYTRGATEPRDLDIDVEIDCDDDRYLQHFVISLSAGRPEPDHSPGIGRLPPDAPIEVLRMLVNACEVGYAAALNDIRNGDLDGEIGVWRPDLAEQ